METKHLYEFGDFRLDVSERILLCQGETVALPPKVFETLLLLVRNSGHIVEREQLLNVVWSDSFVEEGNLTYTISVLRKTLAEVSGDADFIETVPKRGYRFKSQVKEIEDRQTNLVYEKHATASFFIEESDSEPPAQLLKEQEAVQVRQASTPQAALAVSAQVSKGGRKGQPNRIALAATALLLLSGLGGLVWKYYKSEPAAAVTVKSIAVLPFKTLAAKGDDAYLELGMADALITNLSNVRQLVVRPTSAVSRYIEQSKTGIEAGRELQVDAVLEGSVQRQEDRIRVTVQLIQVRDGQPLWGAKFDEKFTDIFALQDSLAAQITGALELRLTREEQRWLGKRYTRNTEAYQDYLRGRFYWGKWNRESLHKAIESFEQALAKDKEFALAYGGIADSYGVLGYLNILPPKEAYPKSKAAALKALELDNTMGESYVALAQSKLFYEWDFTGAEKDLQRAVELSPNYADAHGLYGTYLTAVGRLDEALAERKRAVEIDPVSPFTVNSVGWVYYYKGDYDKALEWHKKALELDGSFALAHLDVGNAYYQKGLYAEAVNEFLKQKRLTGTSPAEIEALGQAFASTGMQGYWQKEIDLATEQMKRTGVRNWRMVRLYALSGDRERTFEHLEQALAERDSLLIFLKVNPIFAKLHSDKRFAGLLQRIGLIR
jgi:TolB-like protein/DNA-binding winged helix-turn-helix (wHTH) protein/Tfp pilus assembly protein PilF